MIDHIETDTTTGQKVYTIHFSTDIDQEADEPLDTINECLHDLFSIGIREYDEINIDWRDPRTVEVSITNKP